MDVAGQFYGLEALIVPNKWLIVPSNLNKFIEGRRGVRRKNGQEERCRFRGTYFEYKGNDGLHPVYRATVNERTSKTLEV